MSTSTQAGTPSTTVKPPPHELTTVIPDKVHPGESWTIKTIQADGELLLDFIVRHQLAVGAVRRVVGTK